MSRWIVLVLGVGLTFGCAKDSESPASQPAKKTATTAKKVVAKKVETPKKAAVVVPKATLGLFKALPAQMTSDANPITEAKVDLGRMLYFETRISKNHDISCNSCHDVATFGVDNKPTSPGHKGQLGGRNSPTTFNAAGHLSQFWDGRSPDVEDQAKGPVLNPVEMGMADSNTVVTVLKSMPGYVDAFKKAYPQDADPVTWDNYAKAVGAFERGFVTPSRFDTFLKGNQEAITDVEKKGLNVFVATGCITCHMGTYVGGQMYMKLGLVKPWPNLKDTGRIQATKKEADTHVFKVPSLRNITKTAPYMHDGSIKDLKTAVKMMAEHQLGKTLTPADTDAIVAWLGCLDGQIDKEYVKKPVLPKSTDKTPKPDPT